MTKNLLSRSDRFHPGPAPTVSADPNRAGTCHLLSSELETDWWGWSWKWTSAWSSLHHQHAWASWPPLRRWGPSYPAYLWRPGPPPLEPWGLLQRPLKLSCPILPAMPWLDSWSGWQATPKEVRDSFWAPQSSPWDRQGGTPPRAGPRIRPQQATLQWPCLQLSPP